MHPIFQRLRERKLVQWALAYLAGAFALFTGVQAVGEPWGLTDNFLRVVQFVLAVGFFIALTLAWYHGEHGRQRVSGPELLIIAALLTVGGLLGRLFLGPSTVTEHPSTATDAAADPTVPQRPSIAVLPFERLGSMDATFVDGIHYEIIAQLGKISSLDLRSRTSVMPYRGSPKNMRQIGEELDARYLVEGVVGGGGDRVRVNVALFEASSDSRLWEESFDRNLTVSEILELQREVALQVAARLGGEISAADRRVLDVDAPESLAAYERYLEGLSHLRTVEGVGPGDRFQAARRAITAFEEAIDLEPRWAPPLASLGRVHHFLASGGTDREANYTRARTLLDSALALDSLHEPAWRSHAFVLHRWERDFEAAEAAYARADELGDGLGWGLGLLYWSMGRWADAVSAFRQAARTDPLSSIIQLQLGVSLLCAGDFDTAVEQLEVAKEMRGSTPSVPLALAYAYAGDEQAALAEAAALHGQDVYDAQMAHVYASLGRRDEAEARLDAALREASTSPQFLRDHTAAALVLLHGEEAALDYLERAAASSPQSLDDVDCYPAVRELQGHDRYEALMERLGFPGRGARAQRATRR